MNLDTDHRLISLPAHIVASMLSSTRAFSLYLTEAAVPQFLAAGDLPAAVLACVCGGDQMQEWGTSMSGWKQDGRWRETGNRKETGHLVSSPAVLYPMVEGNQLMGKRWFKSCEDGIVGFSPFNYRPNFQV